MINPDIIFSQQKDQLVRLLDKAGILTEKLQSSQVLLEEAENLKKTVEIVRKRCNENMFDILLVAPFQSGKSTTVNALADGREVSPRGLGGGGVKTSACIVKVQSIVEGEEKAIIKWKDDEQLCYSIDDFLGATLRQENLDLSQIYELSKSEIDPLKREEYRRNYFNQIDFIRNHEVKIKLKNKLKNEVDIYNNDRSNYGRNKFDQLKFASSILNFFDRQDLIVLKNKQDFSLDEIQDIRDCL
ncbi:hypothetical protein [Crocosphaera sp.]|uniref:hypothetical protein n=1 Tax=Crocosphaera sp. TaxID=2729996 RepID=UPI0026302540|nr:hypothetical protein [Crocosphaera sp.]MDJ0583233.1 hypothetical protein [Crocosphaera sp.]